MKLLDIAFKDMIRSFRSAVGLVFMFIMPLMVTGLFYFMFGSSARQGEFNLPRINLVVANLDRGGPRLQAGSKSVPGGIHAHTLGELVVEVLRSDEMADLLQVSLVEDANAARTAVDQRQAQVAVIIPTDFSKQFADLYGQATLEFYRDPTLTIGPSVVSSILNQFMDGLSGVKIAVDVAMDATKTQNSALVGQVVQQYLQRTTFQADKLTEEVLDVHTPHQTTKSTNPVLKIIAPIMVAMMVLYAFYTGTASAQSILREEEERTLPRLFITPTPQATILAGKFLAVFLTVGVQMIVLLAAARLIFGIQWGELSDLCMVTAGTVFSAATFGIFINSLIKSTKQGGVVFGGVISMTGMIGMIRVFNINTSSTFSVMNTVTLLVPQGWAIRGFLQTMDGELFNDILMTSLAMLVWGLVFFGVGVWRFSRRYA